MDGISEGRADIGNPIVLHASVRIELVSRDTSHSRAAEPIEIPMGCLASGLPIRADKIPKNHGKRDLRGRLLLDGRTIKTKLHFACPGAAVPVAQISVVAFLVVKLLTIATGGRANTELTTGFVATSIAAVERLLVAVVALFPPFDLVIAALGGAAFERNRIAVEVLLDEASSGATAAVGRRFARRILALFESRENAVATLRGQTGQSDKRTAPTGFQLAIGVASIQRGAVAVVTGL